MPVTGVNVKKSIASVSGRGLFNKLGENETKIVRFAPAVVPTGTPDDVQGEIFYKTIQFYGNQRMGLQLIDQDGNGIALADLREHGTAETGTDDYIARFRAVLEEHGDEEEQRIAKALKPAESHYAQSWEAVPMGKGKYDYQPMQLLRLPMTGAKAVNAIFEKNHLMNEDQFTDPVGGQALLVTREDSGRTTYSAERTGLIVSLDDAVPGWDSPRKQGGFGIFQEPKEVYEALRLKLYDPDMQKEILKISYKGLDWDRLEAKYGL
jgi:hypothetical protein